jgi:hypothetical protein
LVLRVSGFGELEGRSGLRRSRVSLSLISFLLGLADALGAGSLRVRGHWDRDVYKLRLTLGC